MSVSFSDSFANTFHIGKVKRSPMRKEIASLRSQATKLPKSKDQQALLVSLTEAAKFVDKKAKTNTERQTSLDEAEKLMVDIRQKLGTLQSSAPSRKEATFKTKTATKEDQNRAAQLLKLVEEIKSDIETMFTPSSGKPTVNMQSSSETTAFTRMALTGQAERIRLTINSSIVDVTTDTTIRDQIKALRTTMKEAEDSAEEVRIAARNYMKLVEHGEGVLDLLKQEMGPKATDSPLALMIEALRSVLEPEGGMLDPTGMVTNFEALQDELDKIDIDDLEDYGDQATKELDEKAQGEQNVQLFDKGTTIDDKLAALRLLSEPLDSPDHGEAYNAVLLTRAKIRALDPLYLDPDAQHNLIVKDIDDRAVRLQGDLDKLFNEAESKLDKVDKKITALKDTRTGPVLTLGKKKEQPAFQADWKEIDGMMASITKMMPPSAVGLKSQDISNLTAVKPLIEAVEKRLDGLTQQTDSNDPASIVGFEQRLADHMQALKDEDHHGKPLRRYYKDDLAKLKEAFDKFKKDLPKAKASAASAALKKLEDDFAKKLTTARELATYVDDTLTPAVQPLFMSYNLLNLDGALPDPNTQGMALQALSDQLRAKPPTKDKLVQLVAEVTKAFEDIESDRDLIDKVRESHKVEKQKKTDKKTQDKETKAPLWDRLEGLKRLADEAREEVASVKGDKNVLKQIERMIEQADGEIEAVNDKGATKTMDRIQQHIDLVFANPKGEVARRRQELPGLYNEWARIRDTAGSNLDEVKLMVESYKPDKKTEKKTARLGKRIDAYRRTFAKGHGQLRHLIGTLSDDEQPDQARRDAREQALAAISGLLHGLQAHPLSQLLAKSPIPAARAVPGRLMAGLDRLNFTILTSVE